MADAQALYETLDAVIAADALPMSPQHIGWRQSSWCAVLRDAETNICGTAACFAGHRLILDGYDVVGYDAMETPTGERVDGSEIEELATERLDLTVEQAHRLFNGDNDLARIKAVVDHIAAGGCGDPECEGCRG